MYSTHFIPARDKLVELGFITYGHGVPVNMTPEFRAFAEEIGPEWSSIEPALSGRPTARALIAQVSPIPEQAIEARPAFPTTEEDEVFYGRLKAQLDPIIRGDVENVGESLFLPTARLGGMRTGRFSRPDITYLVVARYPLSGTRILDVISVEAKIWTTADDVVAAYEAIAYRRFSTQVYFAYESPGESHRISNDVEEILRENGVGILRLWRDGDQDRARIDARPIRHEPPPERLEQWLDRLRQIDEAKVTRLLHSMFR